MASKRTRIKPAEKQTIYLGDREGYEDPRYLHVPADGAGAKLVSDIMDLIETRFREWGGPGSEDKLLCGGCVTGVISEIPKEMFRRGDATYRDARGWANTLTSAMKRLRDSAADGADKFGDEGRIFGKNKRLTKKQREERGGSIDIGGGRLGIDVDGIKAMIERAMANMTETTNG